MLDNTNIGNIHADIISIFQNDKGTPFSCVLISQYVIYVLYVCVVHYTRFLRSYVEYRFVSPGADEDDVIGPEGMEKFCEDIGVEPENVRLASHHVRSPLVRCPSCTRHLGTPSSSHH